MGVCGCVCVCVCDLASLLGRFGFILGPKADKGAFFGGSKFDFLYTSQDFIQFGSHVDSILDPKIYPESSPNQSSETIREIRICRRREVAGVCVCVFVFAFARQHW